MSYSFSVKAATKAEAREIVAAEFDKIVLSQPVHAADRGQAEAAALSFLDLLPEGDMLDITLQIYGSVYVPDAGLRSVSFNFTGNCQPKPAA